MWVLVGFRELFLDVLLVEGDMVNERGSWETAGVKR
jgi:hypothetical protein